VEGEVTAALEPVMAALGLGGFALLASAVVGGELELLVETTETVTGCPSCGLVATAHGRREHLVREAPLAGVPVAIMWAKRVWRCGDPVCPKRTWSEQHPAIAPRSALTERAAGWILDQVGRAGRTVTAVRRELAVGGWHTVMRRVWRLGAPLVDEPARLAGVTGLGVDETVVLHAGAYPLSDPDAPPPAPGAVRRRSCAPQLVTGVVDTSPGRPPRLLDVLPGRTAAALTGWLEQRDQPWRDGVQVASLDPYRGYATALRRGLPDATRVLDAFHVVRLALAALDDVRRRVQQEQTGHRGRKHDPLYRARRVLRRRADRLTPANRQKIEAALTAADPDGEIWAAWIIAQHVMAIYPAPSAETGRARAEHAIKAALDCPVPEVARLGRTLHAWRDELLAYFTTDGASNGPVEALNLLIEKTRRDAHGFRNIANYRLRLLLTHGGIWNTPPEPRIRTRHPRMVA
jgi:transposase